MKFLKNWTIDLAKLPAYTCFKGNFNVELDYELLKLCYESNNENFTEDRKKLLLPILEKINKKTNILKVSHNQRHNLGRFYADESISPINVSRHIKHTLFHYLEWVDIDMVKGHPTILYEIAKNNQIQLHAFKKYLDNPQAIFKELIEYYSVENETPLTSDNVKGIFNIGIYGGNHNTWLEDMDKENVSIRTNIPHPFVTLFLSDCKIIKEIIYLNNSGIVDLVKKDATDENKIKRRVMSYFCGAIENEILAITYKYLLKKKIIQNKINNLLEYDGLCFKNSNLFRMLKNPNDNETHQIHKIVSEINSEIVKNTKLNVYMTFKQYNPNYVHTDIIEIRKQMIDTNNNNTEIESESIAICDNDEQCANYIIGLLKDKLVYTNGAIFYKNGHIWTNDIILIENMLISFIMKNSPYKNGPFGLVDGYKNLSAVKPVIKVIFAFISITPDDTIYQKFHSTTKGRLAFKDGVLCAFANKFYLWEKIDFEYYTTICINREFNQYLLNPDWELMERIIDKIFKPLFDKDWELALSFISRAIMGHTEDKNWATFVGNRNSGKGVSYELMKNSCGDYIGSFKVDNILVQREGNGKETAKDLYWLLELEFMRLAVAQETPPDCNKYKISAPLLKKICSGGDTQIARRNYDRKDTHFTTDASPLIMGNDQLECSTADCNEHRFQFSSIIQFKTPEQIEELKELNLPGNIMSERFGIIDYSLKDKCRSEEWCNAFILIIMRYYQNEPLSVIHKKEEEIDDSEKPLLCRIYDAFEITNNEKDIVLASEVEALFMSEKKKLTLELQGLGVQKKRNKKEGMMRDKMCYLGLKIKNVVEEENI